jgi:hypothetical protein
MESGQLVSMLLDSVNWALVVGIHRMMVEMIRIKMQKNQTHWRVLNGQEAQIEALQ